MKFKLKKSQVFLVTSFLTLTINFYTNFFSVADQTRFNNYSNGGESLVLGRLIANDLYGTLCKGAMLMRIVPEGTSADEARFLQYTAYENNVLIKGKPSFYKSTIGGQGLFFSLFDSLFYCISGRNKMALFRFLTSVLTAFVISSLILSFYRLYENFYFSLFLLFIANSSIWLIYFGRNLYWFTSAFFIPFIFLMYIFYREQKEYTNLRLFLLSFFIFLIKVFFNGMEYISSILIMSCIPVFIYAIIKEWRFKVFLSRFLVVSFAFITSIIFSFIIQSIQISLISGSFSDGVNHIYTSFLRKSTDLNFAGQIKYSHLKSDLFKDILPYYINSEVLCFFKVKIKAIHLILTLLIISVISILFRPMFKQRVFLAFLIGSWLSLLASLSWIVVFKGHCYHHKHINNIVWYFPFVFFVSGFVFYFVKESAVFLQKKKYSLAND